MTARCCSVQIVPGPGVKLEGSYTLAAYIARFVGLRLVWQSGVKVSQDCGASSFRIKDGTFVIKIHIITWRHMTKDKNSAR
jgi:hypothetical protein